jgi:DNA-binding NarL/FixJ family response regulator
VTEQRIRILVCDDHPVVRAGLKGMLSAQPDFEVVGEAEDGISAVTLHRDLFPDVTLMDLQMPRLGGVEAIEQIIAHDTRAQVLVLTTYATDTDVLCAVEAGASGYLLKDADPGDVFAAVRAIARGQSALSPKVARRLMTNMREDTSEFLSAREIEVLELVARGSANKEVAKALHISTATVKTHMVHIFSKLGVADRTAAVTTALSRGIISLEDEGV